jgi:plastocyanin
MLNQYVWAAITGAVFVAGIGIGYAVFASTAVTPQQMMLANQQMMNTWMQDPTTSRQMMGWIYQNPQFMQNMMSDPQFQSQMVQHMQQNQQFHQNTMTPMIDDPTLRQQMMGYMMNDQQFMQQWMGNSTFQRNWMYPYATENWRMGPGMGSGMMGGSMMNWGAANPSNSQAVETSEVTIPTDAWSTRSTSPYQPLRIQIEEGTEVTWTNNDSMVHTVTDVENNFDSNLIDAGESWSYTFNAEGTYNYYCTMHPWMRGAVLVE